ncbi:MAG: phosphoribosylanthranilate isomerase [Longimicrobiales bacterium]
MTGPKVKICGLRHPADVALADRAGADFVGVILSAGFGRSVAVDDAAALVEGIDAIPVAVLVDESVEEAALRARTIRAGVVQLHGSESPERVRAVADAGPWRVWKAVRLRAGDDLEAATAPFAELVGGFLFEGWKEGVVGGGGVRLAASLAADVRRVLPEGVDFVLAGGLTPAGVGEAVARFAPDVVDVSSGVEAGSGRKDPEAVRRFIREARRAGAGSPQRESST